MQNLNIYLIDFLIRSYIYKKTVYKATSIFSRAIKLLLWRSRSAVFVIFGGFSGGPLAGVAHLLVEHVTSTVRRVQREKTMRRWGRGPLASYVEAHTRVMCTCRLRGG
jgi:hypothetical protein